MSFEGWLGKLLGHRESEVQQLLRDPSALHFLMAWSLLEAKCFHGFVKLADIDSFCERVVKQEGFDVAAIAEAAAHFHERYQENRLYQQLMHQQTSKRMEGILSRTFGSLSPEEMMFLVTLVAYRYRNNIFHGNKGVHSWLIYRRQIEYGVEVMQSIIDHAETRVPTMLTPSAA